MKTFTIDASRQTVGHLGGLDRVSKSGLDLRLAKRLNYCGMQIFGVLGSLRSRKGSIYLKQRSETV